MFQLIVAVISIALVAALAIASIFYGGDAFTKSSTKAQVTTLINQGQQLSGANALYKTDNGVNAPTVADLLESAEGVQYLAAAPGGTKVTEGNPWVLVPADGVATIDFSATDTSEFCEEVVRQDVGSCAGTGPAYSYFSFAL